MSNQQHSFWKPPAISSAGNISSSVGRAKGPPFLALPPPPPPPEGTHQFPTTLVSQTQQHFLYLLDQYQMVVVVCLPNHDIGLNLSPVSSLALLLDKAGVFHTGSPTSEGRKLAIAMPNELSVIEEARVMSHQYGPPPMSRHSHSAGNAVVGYSVRWEEREGTRIKFMSNSQLYQETLLDPLLSRYSCILLDRIQDRTLMTDLMIGVLKKILRKRTDLRIVLLSSAPYSRDAEHMCTYFNRNQEEKDKANAEANSSKPTAVLFQMPGTEGYPVDIVHLSKPSSNYMDDAIELALKIHSSSTADQDGDILLVATHEKELDSFDSLLRERLSEARGKLNQLVLHTLTGSLSGEEVALIQQPLPKGFRKLILATSMAESSVSVPGIRFVIDCGFTSLSVYDPKTGVERIGTVPISQAQADQRASLAGRTRMGKTYRLYTQSTYSRLSPTKPPEMQRKSLVSTILQLKALGIEDVLHFDYPSSPPAQMMAKGLAVLYSLRIVEEYGRLSLPLGMSVAEFPVDPMLATMLWNSGSFGCGEEVLTLLALLTVGPIFLPVPDGRRRGVEDGRRHYYVEEGDHITYINVYNAFLQSGNNSQSWCGKHMLNHAALQRVLPIRNLLRRYLLRFNIPIRSCGMDTESLRKCMISGYFSQCVRMNPDGSYSPIVAAAHAGTTLRRRGLDEGMLRMRIHPSSVLYRRNPLFLLYHEVTSGGGGDPGGEREGDIWMRVVTVVEPEWLVQVAPHFYTLASSSSSVL